MKREIKLTEDGSTTLYVPGLNENYHSVHGAVQESVHVFIRSGLFALKERDEVHIFEMGFGTGLNCLLSLIHSEKSKIHYFALEKYPLEDELIKQLNYPGILKINHSDPDYFNLIHSTPWDNSNYEVCKNFVLKKCTGDILNINIKEQFDLIYFDAFAPQFQPELWTKGIFQKMYDILGIGGILVTYCAKGEVRRNMEQCGFKVERIPGPPGKREMLRAIKVL